MRRLMWAVAPKAMLRLLNWEEGQLYGLRRTDGPWPRTYSVDKRVPHNSRRGRLLRKEIAKNTRCNERVVFGTTEHPNFADRALTRGMERLRK